jgi:hypothetical protein
MAVDVATGTLQTGTAAAGNTVSVTGLAFQPKAVLFFWSGRTATGQAEGDHKFGAGYAVSTTDRGGFTNQSDHSPTTMATDSRLFSNSCIEMLTVAGAIDGQMDFQSFNSDGFTLVVDDAFAASYLVHYLALGGADITDVASVTASVTGTGDTDVTTVGFQPDVAFVFGHDLTAAINTNATWSQGSFGVVDTALTNYVLAGYSEDAIGTSDTGSYCRAGECVAVVGGATSTSVDHRASISAWLSTGFRMNVAVHVGGTAICRVLCIKGGRWKAGDFTTHTDTLGGTVTGTGFQPKALVVGSHNKVASTAGTAQAHDERSLGFAITNAAGGQSYASIIDKDAATTADVGVAANTNGFYANQSTATTIAIEGVAGLSSMDSDGFTFVHSDADPSAAFAWYLAVGDNAGGGGGTNRRRRVLLGGGL